MQGRGSWSHRIYELKDGNDELDFSSPSIWLHLEAAGVNCCCCPLELQFIHNHLSVCLCHLVHAHLVAFQINAKTKQKIETGFIPSSPVIKCIQPSIRTMQIEMHWDSGLKIQEASKGIWYFRWLFFPRWFPIQKVTSDGKGSVHPVDRKKQSPIQFSYVVCHLMPCARWPLQKNTIIIIQAGKIGHKKRCLECLKWT